MTTENSIFGHLLPFEDAIQIGFDTFLTCEHSASSYGKPVMVWHGNAYGSGDVVDGYFDAPCTARQMVEHLTRDTPDSIRSEEYRHFLGKFLAQ